MTAEDLPIRDGPLQHDELQHPQTRAYVAANLREALKLVPDTGDWHGMLRQWCDRNAGGVMPNQTAEEMRQRLCDEVSHNRG